MGNDFVGNGNESGNNSIKRGAVLGAAAARRRRAAVAASQILAENTAEGLAAEVNARVVGQEDAVRDVCSFLLSALGRSEKLCSGTPEADLPHLDAIMIDGPSGCGKTYIVQSACEELGIEVATIDGSSLTGAGWRGGDIDKHLYRLAQAQARPGGAAPTVVFIDECDKLAKDETRAAGFSPCAGLLRVIEGSEVMTVDSDEAGGKALPLDKAMLIFVLAGAFTGLDEAVRRRLVKGGTTGFTADPAALAAASADEGELRALAGPEDLISCGLPRELVGRITTLTRVRPLNEAELAQVVRGARGSAASRFAAMMPAGCALKVDDSAVALVASDAASSGRGARGIEAALGKACMGAVEAARTDASIVTARVTAESDGLEVSYEHGEREVPDPLEDMDIFDDEHEPDNGGTGARMAFPFNGARKGSGDAEPAASGWEPPAWGAEERSGVVGLAIRMRVCGAGAPDPVSFAGGSTDAVRISDAIVSTLLRGMIPSRALVASELVYGCITFMRHWRQKEELNSAQLLALVREAAEGTLRDRVLALIEGRPMAGDARGAGPRRWPVPETGSQKTTCGIIHTGIDIREDSALRRLVDFYGLAGDDARSIAAEVADRIAPLADGKK